MAEAKKTLRITQVKSSDRPPGRPGQDAAALWASARSAARSTRWTTTSVRGMIFKVKHLVEVEEL